MSDLEPEASDGAEVKGAEGEVAAADALTTPVVSLIDEFLGYLRIFEARPRMFDMIRDYAAMVGLYGILGVGVLALVASIVQAARAKDLALPPVGLACVLGVIVLHFCAAKFATAGKRVIAAETRQIGSAAFLDCVGLLALAGAVAALVAGVAFSIRFRSVAMLWRPLVGAFGLACAALFSLNPRQMLNLEVVEEGVSAGETALAVLCFAVRTVLAGAPILLGVGVAVGGVRMLVAMILSWTGHPATEIARAFGMCVFFALFPLIAYVGYLLYALVVDFYLAVLRTARNTER